MSDNENDDNDYYDESSEEESSDSDNDDNDDEIEIKDILDYVVNNHNRTLKNNEVNYIKKILNRLN